MKIFIRIILLATFCKGVNANETNSRILSISTLEKMGYKESRFMKYNGKQCDSYELNFPAEKQYQSIKSLDSISIGTNGYYRFTLIKEKFETEELAIKRFAQFVPPNRVKANSWYSKSCSLKKGFRNGNEVYFVATDGGMFTDQIPEVLEALRQALKK